MASSQNGGVFHEQLPDLFSIECENVASVDYRDAFKSRVDDGLGARGFGHPPEAFSVSSKSVWQSQ